MKKNDSKCRYLIIDAKDVVNYPKSVLNGTFNDYYRCDMPFISLNEIFDDYGIPEKYRYLIVRINPLISKTNCQEYFDEKPFEYQILRRENNQKLILGSSISKNANNIIRFETGINYLPYENVMRMIVQLTNEGLYDQYKMAVSELLNLQFSNENIGILTKYRKKTKK